MLPQVHLNIGPGSFDRFYQYCLPLIPGGLLVTGWLAAQPDVMPIVRSTFGLGPYSGIAAILVSAYFVGFVLLAASGILTGVVSGIASGLVFRSWTPRRWSSVLSRDFVWRSVAGKFLGEKLTPTRPTGPAAHGQSLTDIQNYDAMWEEWYRILQDYLLRDVPVMSNDFVLASTTVHATGWAGLALSLSIPAASHWIGYLLASAFIIWGLLFQGLLFQFLAVFNYLANERLPYADFTARLLAECRRDNSKGSGN